ncbi:DNA-directed RNA polymerase II subunit rpb1 [Elsinoe australis]|uniref:DNA-directed RNA polymerase II subunit rpb1 n=1 Tax=Elsinoe australis TaxID=40998 RepID=A0A2P8AFL0_9PEZI|nr:DNA-directed RNA polymerase II subunit rpb1 [Elsinoe australis]
MKRADTLEQERDECDVKTAMLEIELSSEKEDHKKLKESGEKNQESLNDLLEQNMKLKDALAEKDKRISIVEAQMKDERSKQQKADTSERDQAIITDLRKRLAEVRAEPDERIGRIEQLEHELFTARAEVNELQNWRKYWMSDHPDEAAQFIELQAHMDAKSTEVNIGMSYVEKLSSEIADLEEQLQGQGIPVRQADSEFRRGISQWSARLRGLKFKSQGTQTEKLTSDSGTQTENLTSHHGTQNETSRKEAGTQSDNTTQIETSHGVAGIPFSNSPSPRPKPTYASSGTQSDNTSPQYTSQATQTANGPASDNSNADNNAAKIASLEAALKLCKQHGATSAKTITDLTTKMASKDATIKQLEEHVTEVEKKAAGEARVKASEEGREAVGDEDSSEGEGPVDDLARLEAELEGDDSGGSSDGDEEGNDNPAVPGCEGCNKLTGRLVGARKMAADLTAKLKGWEDRFVAAEEELMDAQDVVTELEDRVAELEESEAASTTRLDELSAANERLTQELDDKITTSSELWAEREDLKRDLANRIKESEETIADLKNDLIKQRRLRTEEVEALKEQATRLKEQTVNYQTTERETRAQLSQFRIRYRREGSTLPQQELTQVLLLARQKHAELRAEIKRQRSECAAMRKKQREEIAMLISARQTYWLMTFRFKTLDANRADVKTLWDHVPLQVRIKSDGDVEDGAEDAKDGDGVQEGGQY